MFLDGVFVEILGLPFDDVQGVIGAFPQAGPQAVAIFFGGQGGLAVYDLDGAFGAGGDAQAATVATFGVDFNYFTFNDH